MTIKTYNIKQYVFYVNNSQMPKIIIELYFKIKKKLFHIQLIFLYKR